MISFDEAVELTMALPDVVEGTKWGRRTWSVGGKGFVWERPFTKADIKRHLPHTLPTGPIMALATDDLAEKEAILAIHHRGFFTIEHFDGYPAYLVQLDEVDPDVFREALVDSWLCCAPAALGAAYLSEHGPA